VSRDGDPLPYDRDASEDKGGFGIEAKKQGPREDCPIN
jgi:hypothetical protein